MKNGFQLLFLTAVLFSCGTKTNTSTMKENKNIVTQKDTTPKVIGIGGIFFFSENPKNTKDWYAKNLGMVMTPWGASFESRNAQNPEEINYTQWSLFKKGDEYFSPSKKDFMINYRVQNIEGLVRKLRKNGVNILDTITTYDYGKFVHLMDNDGNKIELWEPIDSSLTKIGSETNK